MTSVTDSEWEDWAAAVPHLTSQLLILLHQPLVLLVDSQDLADTVGSRLGLKMRDGNTKYFYHTVIEELTVVLC